MRRAFVRIRHLFCKDEHQLEAPQISASGSIVTKHRSISIADTADGAVFSSQYPPPASIGHDRSRAGREGLGLSFTGIVTILKRTINAELTLGFPCAQTSADKVANLAGSRLACVQLPEWPRNSLNRLQGKA